VDNIVMQIKFTKMHGLGNDFVVIDAIHQDVRLTTEQYRFIADRHLGIGCDQVLLVENPQSSDVDFRYRIFNADGGEVEQCGNGARCFARFVRDQGLSDKTVIAVETNTGIIELSMQADGQVTVNMGPARLQPAAIPFIAEESAPFYSLDVDGRQYEVGAVSMGNPHVVLAIDDIDTAPVTTLGPVLEQHQRFPQRVNVGFMQVVDRENIRLRVWERGTGETMACGSGACAAVVSGIIRGWLEPLVVVHLQLGNLVVQWQGIDQPVFMTGPAASVFEGTIQL
jgi:diaminopimelate epimerase